MSDIYLGVGIDASAAVEGQKTYEAAADVIIQKSQKLVSQLSALTKGFKKAFQESYTLCEALDMGVDYMHLFESTTKGTSVSVDGVTQILGQFNTAFVDAGKVMKDTSEYMRRTQTTLGNLASAVDKGTKRMRDSMNNVANATVNAGNKIKDAGNETERTGKKMKKNTENVKTFDIAMLGVAVTVQSVVHSMTQLAKVTLRDYGFKMAEVAAATNANVEEMKSLEKVTRQLGRDTLHSATDAAESAKILGRAGFSVKEIIDALPHALGLAAAATVDVGKATATTAHLMAGFKLSATDMSKAADILAATSNHAQIDIEQMGAAMRFSGPLAKELGLDIEELTAAVGAIASTGLSGSEIGRGLRNAFKSLVKPTDEAKKAIQSLGLHVDDVNPMLVGMTGVVENLTNAGFGVTDAFAMFERTAQTAMTALVGNREKFKELRDVAAAAAGEVSRMSGIMHDTWLGDIARAVGATAELILALGDAGLTKTLRNSTQSGRDAILLMTEAIKKVGELNLGFNAIGETIKAIALLVSVAAMIAFLKQVLVLVTLISAQVNGWAVGITIITSYLLEMGMLNSETAKLNKHTKTQLDLLRAMEGAKRTNLVLDQSITMEALKQQKIAAIDKERKASESIRMREQEVMLAGPAATVTTGEGHYSPTEALRKAKEEQAIANIWIEHYDKEIEKLEKLHAAQLKALEPKRSLPPPVSTADDDGAAERRRAKEALEKLMAQEAAAAESLHKEVASRELQLKLAQNLGAAESDLYRIRLEDSALHDARKAGLSGISNEMQELINRAVELYKQESKLRETYNIQDDFIRALKTKKDELDKTVSATDKLGKSESELLRNELEMQAMIVAQKAGLSELNPEWEQMIDTIVRTKKALDQARETADFTTKMQGLLESKQKDVDIEIKRAELAQLYKNDLVELETQLEMYNLVRDNGLKLDSIEAKELEERIRQYKRLLNAKVELEGATQKQIKAEQEWISSMTYAFKDAIMNTKTLADALSSLANRIKNMMVDKALDKLLGGVFSKFALGGVIDAGRVTPYASGGVVAAPTFFSTNTGIGLMGESGPEAIMPLSRTSSGELGVKATGGRSNIQTNITINVEGGSEEENNDTADKVSKAVKNVIDNTVMSILLREKRPGGIL